MSMIKSPTVYLSLFMAVTVIMAAAELKRFEHKVKPDGSFSFLVVGDWGRSGLYNQSNVAYQNVEVALEESTARWKIVVGHHTLFSAGVHGTTLELLDKLLPILQEHDVNLYINGHDHCLQHISSPNSQLQFLTSGGGSKAWRGDFNLENLNEMKFFYDGQGFMAAEVRGNDLNLAFYDIFGNILHKWSASDNPHSSL